MCFSLSNSAIERIFNLLTTLLNDRQLSMRHDTMEDCLLIAGNNSSWSDEKYLQKKWKTKIEDATKVSVLASYIDQSENNDSSSVSSFSDEYSDMEVYSK